MENKQMFNNTELGLIYALVNESIKMNLDPKTQKPVDPLEQIYVNKIKQIICDKIADKLNPKTTAYPKPSPCEEYDCTCKDKPRVPIHAIVLGKVLCDILGIETEKKEGKQK